jgi:predicted nucleic acid-binding protein
VNVLVDTSVWSLALRRPARKRNASEEKVVAELSELIREGRARMLGLIRQELLSGIRAIEQYEKLRKRLRGFADEPISTEDHEEAAKAGNLCREKGISVSVVNVLICAVAARRRWPIFSTDPDFETYSRVVPVVLHSPRR